MSARRAPKSPVYEPQQAIPLAIACGSLILGGFSGEELPPEYEAALKQGRRAGAILFRRNLPSLEAGLALNASLIQASPTPCFIALDQEGGRVRRLTSQVLETPSMGQLGALFGPSQFEELGRAVGAELAALGYNLNFAPVLDIHSNPQNPVIGDRAFSGSPSRVAELALAYARGLEGSKIIPCGKHFPGHGDTAQDSHLELPRLSHAFTRLEQVELVPFRAAAAAKLPSLMTAHIVFQALDEERPATLSPAVLQGLLREQLGYQGVVFSDCLEMHAISKRYSIADAALQAISAGCDCVLVCHSFAEQEAAFEALLHEAERSPAFRARAVEAAVRSFALRHAFTPHPQPEKLPQLFAAHAPLQEALRSIKFPQDITQDPTEAGS